MADKANGAQRLRELLAASCCAEPWRFNELTQTVVSGQSHPLARITEAAHRLTFAGTTGREGELIVEAINALPGLLADYEQLEAKLEAAERDAALIEFLNSTSFTVDVRNGRVYSGGPGSVRTVVAMAKQYQDAQRQEGK